MGATDGGERDTEGTVALQGVRGRDPCTPFPRPETRGLQVCAPPTPLKQKQAPPLSVTMLRSTTSCRHSPL